MGGAGNGFQVDPDRVRDFGSQVRASLDDHVLPQSAFITESFGKGVGFGRHTASTAVFGLAETYYSQLDQNLRLLQAFTHDAEVMIQAASDIAAAYGQADVLTADQMQTLLAEAGVEVDHGVAESHPQRSAGSR